MDSSKWIIVIVVGTIVLVVYEAFTKVNGTAAASAASTALADSTATAIGDLGVYGTAGGPSIAAQDSSLNTLLDAYNNPLLTEAQQLQIGSSLASLGIDDPSTWF